MCVISLCTRGALDTWSRGRSTAALADMTFTLSYRLTGTGWAECSLSDGQASCVIRASYLSDCLLNLVLAATAVASGFTRVSFRFDEEPGEYRWVITSPRLNEIELEILSFDELWGGRPDDEGRSLFKTRCLPEVFAKTVHDVAQQLLAEHGETGYLAKWVEHPFPSVQLSELNRLVRTAQHVG